MKPATSWYLLPAALLLAAQVNAGPVTGDPDTVTLYVTVEGRGLARELGPRNFRVWEDGWAQRVLRADPAGPATVVLLVENNLMSWMSLRDTHQAMRGFLESAPRHYTYALVTYSRGANLAAGLTSDLDDIAAAYAGLRRSAYDGTDLLDAVYQVAGELEQVPGRRAILLVGSGLDTASRHTLSEVQRKLEASNVLVYGLATGLDFRREDFKFPDSIRQADLRFGDLRLQTLAGTTGGRLLIPACENDYADAMRSILSALTSQYEVVYERAFAAAPGFHQVRVEASRMQEGKLQQFRLAVRPGWRD